MKFSTSLAAAAFVLSAGVASATPVTFYLGSGFYGGPTPSCVMNGDDPATASCSKDGISLTAYGYTYDPSTGLLDEQKDVDQNMFGLGIDSGRYDLNWVDNQGKDEALVLEFSPDVTIHSLTFAHVDGNDEFTFGILEDLFSEPNPYLEFDIPGYGISTKVFAEMYTGGLFIVGTSEDNCGCDNDNWRLKYVTVKEAPNVVPLPAAGWMLIAGLGGIAAMKRRKRAA